MSQATRISYVPPGVVPETIITGIDYNYNLPANAILLGVKVTTDQNLPAFSIGETNGGQELLPAQLISANPGQWILLNAFYGANPQSIWFNGITGTGASVTLKIYKLN